MTEQTMTKQAMTGKERRALAIAVERKLDLMRADFKAVLLKHGFEGVEIISFSIAPAPETKAHIMLDGSPCPTKCVVLPDGRIECKPVC
jgi:hypothetical protein